jgi:hypothetical protein
MVRAMFKGTRPFPLEMLRMDECFPHQNEDVIEILKSIKNEENDDKIRVVTVAKYSDRQWHVDRWQLLGWKLEKLFLT